MKQLLQQYFGFSEFREGQEHVISALMNGQSAAAIFPTGSGKSLCYQLPALALPHLTLVVSPLLALMKDQLDFLLQRGIPAARIQSMQSHEEASQVYKSVSQGITKILFISVERLNSERFRVFLKKIPISLLVVDEAHCISEWGHNFRPDYLKLAAYRQEFNIPQRLLLTATATTAVIKDMSDKFEISPENIVLTGAYRSNLDLSVIGVTEQKKLSILLPWLQPRLQSSGIIYVTLQQTAQQVADQLQQKGISATAYHAGLDNDLRVSIQERFMSGKLPLIVATIAFGMGIDKSNIRYVVHYDLPKSIENYSQEIGRAGRDGQRSDCLLLANHNNLNVLENFVYGDTPEPSAIDYILNEIMQCDGHDNAQWDVLMNSLSTQSNIRLLVLKTLLVYLELEGVLKPAYSYYAEYKFKLLVSRETLLSRFKDERYHFVDAILQSAQKAKTWLTMDFDKLNSFYPSERNRAITAIDYLYQQGLIELQTKQMTNVYRIFKSQINDELRNKLVVKFAEKETSEVQRIHFLLSFFASSRCLSLQLAHYFSDQRLQQNCGHCSVCRGEVAIMPIIADLPSLTQYNAAQLSQEVVNKLGNACTSTLLARFFCGLTTPIFTRLKLRQVRGFAQFEKYRFADVKAWLENK